MINKNIEDLEKYANLIGSHPLFTNESVKKDIKSCKEREEFESKVLFSIEEAIDKVQLRDGMTISFHHHFRDGDFVLNKVMDVIAKKGIKNLTLAASSLLAVHSPLIEHVKNGVVSKIETSGMRGDFADAVSFGLLDTPVIFRSHGGRAYAIKNGDIKIDVAFLGAPSCDSFGNANGYSRENDNGVICGSLGYAKTDAQYAKKVIILTDNLVPFPNLPAGVAQSEVNYVVKVNAIGDPNGIMSGATRFTKNPKELLIAETTAEVIEHSGVFKNGFSFQMGSGGASLATARFLREKMLKNNIKADFVLGGITGVIVKLHEEGLIKKILDVQSFDLEAAKSLKNNRFHQQISAYYYASPFNLGTAVNQLDVVILSALEVDVNFNVNVLTGSDGSIRGAIGGHQDTAEGASVTIVVCPLTRGRIASIVDAVDTIVTPGKSIDIVVTDQGVAINPNRKDLIERLRKTDINLTTIEELRKKVINLVGRGKSIEYTDKVVGIVTYRDGSIIDLIYQVKDSTEGED